MSGDVRTEFRTHRAAGGRLGRCSPLFGIWPLTWLSVAFSASSYSKPSFPWKQTATLSFSMHCTHHWWLQQNTYFKTLSFSKKVEETTWAGLLLHPRLRNDLLNIDPISPVNTTAVQVAPWLEIVMNKGEINTVLNARHRSLRQMELKWDEVKGQTAANPGDTVAPTHVKWNWLHREGPDSAANLLFF